MRLDVLCRAVPGARIVGEPGIRVRDVHHDSRECGPGSLFVALAGRHHNGLSYLDEAVGRGAVAVVTDRPSRTVAGLTVVEVADTRRALGLLAAEFHGHPSRKLRVIGITGTNGKTTTTVLLQAILAASGRKVGLIGTLGTLISGEIVAGRHTTPESSNIQRTLAGMVGAGITDVVMEVSSHALALCRVEGIRFGAGVFTNLSPEHLDFHHDLDHYRDTKARLFSGLDAEAVAVLNADDPVHKLMARGTRARLVTFGLECPATVHGRVLALDLRGTTIEVTAGDSSFVARTPLVGRFNAANVLAASAAGLALGAVPDAISAGVQAVAGVPGRFERVMAGTGPAVFVDYAHTPDGLSKVLETLRECTSGRVITVFGCGGDRDPHKRPVMGRLAASLSDVVIVTSDNPRSEDPAAIVSAILTGTESTGSDVRVILDRAQAIKTAVAVAGPDDAVMIAGKGHETYQVIGERKLPFDDRERARAALLDLKAGGTV